MNPTRHLRLTLAAALAVAALSPLRAQETPVSQPTEITSVALEMWSTDTETHGIFNGNVVVTGTNLKLTCDRLEVIASRVGDKTATVGTMEKFKHLLATGKVNIIQGDREVNCGRAEVFPREDKIIITEKVVVIDHSNGGKTYGDMFTLFRGDRRLIAEHIKFIGPELKDLGFDKNEPAPKSDKAPAAPLTPAPGTAK